MEKFNHLFYGIRKLAEDTKPDVIVDLGEYESFTQTFESIVRDINKKGKTYGFFLPSGL